MPTCIYCRRTDPPCGFTREHVLQAAFGSFRNALTLPDEVCAECNQYLGDHLDVVLARDSVEAVLRLAHGMEQEFFDHSQHPGGGVFDPQRQQLKLRGILNDGSYFSLTLTPQQVLDGDLAVIAREFYTAYRAARSAP